MEKKLPSSGSIGTPIRSGWISGCDLFDLPNETYRISSNGVNLFRRCEIASGHYGTVDLYSGGGKACAVKTLFTSPGRGFLGSVVPEVPYSSGIVFCKLFSNGKIVVMELGKEIEPGPFSDMALFLSEATESLISEGFTYTDIKLANMITVDGRYRLVDLDSVALSGADEFFYTATFPFTAFHGINNTCTAILQTWYGAMITLMHFSVLENTAASNFIQTQAAWEAIEAFPKTAIFPPAHPVFLFLARFGTNIPASLVRAFFLFSDQVRDVGQYPWDNRVSEEEKIFWAKTVVFQSMLQLRKPAESSPCVVL